MSNEKEALDPQYVARKRKELLALREQLRTASDTAESEESAVREQSSEQSRQYEDDAQKLDQLETQGELVSRSVARLGRVQRALAKIDEGTYGFSDVSGHRIPEARLDALPDALNTLAEQQAAESR